MQESNTKTMMVVVMLVVGLVVGGGIGYGIGHHNKTTVDSQTTTTTADTDGVTVGGAKMVRTKDIVANALNAKNVTTLVSAVKAADLVSTLQSAGPFTVFAPDNGAFAKIPASTLNSLLQPSNKAELTKILTYHVVSGTYTTAALNVMAQKGETLTSVEGDILTPVMVNNQLEIKDAQGNVVPIVTPDVISSNGVTHVISSVLMP